ncbi:site-specific tyrosine recombinase XerC [Novipirellula galeiformis]|uniref:Site-specific tyrosine recombinase XerC n=1 Tax=Novipirellula galeiformis TaxID=2528004 RepID=A0A5C6CE03_9BACT|nr:tyrosine-type recombinase/integrase [Novipirellula galeiformis]TWU22498.1 site-specific tyrosine recombinase XerC [Novipirellula galeiformis]
MGTLFRRTRAGKRSNWIAEYTDHAGARVQKSTRTPDKTLAKQILGHWESEEAKRSSGMIDPAVERIQLQSLRPIAEHSAEWIASLRSSGRSSVHTDRHETRLALVVDQCQWLTIRDITPESFSTFAAGLRDRGRSAQTVAHYAQAAKQFTRWLTRTGRLPRNPLETISKPNPKSDRRRERRMLLPAEWPWLSAAAGPRALLYEVAIQTGLRSGELRSLKPGNVKLDAHPPHVLIRSGETKDSELARQYITADLRDRLRSIGPANRQHWFALPDKHNMADMIRDDLADARVAWESRPGADKKSDAENDFLLPTNDAGERFDFHALRHTCGAWLAIRKVHPKTIQTVMRHKTITLTMDTYGHLFPGAEPEAINEIGRILHQ